MSTQPATALSLSSNRHRTLRALVVPLLASLVLLVATVGKAHAATIDSASYTRSTTGASAAGSVARAADSTGATVYSIGFKLTDTGNDGLPVYVKYRWSVLVSGPSGLQWQTTAASRYDNRLGYGKSVTATARMTESTLQAIAGSTGIAAKLRPQIAVCRDATTDNCSTWWTLTWNTYPDSAYNGIFTCNMDTAVIDIHAFLRPGYVPVQSSPVSLTVVTNLVQSSDSTFSHPSTVLSWVHVVSYPNPLAAATVSNVYAWDAATGTLVDSDGYIPAFHLTPGAYYAVNFEVRMSSAGAEITSNELPSYSWARYGFQNGWTQGTPGDWKCLAR